MDEELAKRSRRLQINVSAAALDGVDAAVGATLADEDHAAHQRKPERLDPFWAEAEASTGD